MSDRDCGKWYCQRAAGHKRLVYGEDILLYPGDRADSDNRRQLQDERLAITGNASTEQLSNPREQLGGWMGEQRAAGFNGWLAAYSHDDGAAHYYWVWDPHSADKYMEAFGPCHAGDIPSDFGEMHRGRGWQLPLVAVFLEAPSARDLVHLAAQNVPYVILEAGGDGGDDPPPPPPPSSDCEKPDFSALNRWDRLNAKLDYITCLLEE